MASGNKYFDWLLKPWTLIMSAILGVLIGLYFKSATNFLDIIGDLFLNLLTMCVVPLLVSAVSTSIAKFIRLHQKIKLLFLIFLVIVVVLVLSGVLGLVVDYLVNLFGHHGAAMNNSLGQMILVDSSHATVSAVSGGLPSLSNLFPKNIVLAMAQNNSLALLSFSIILGLVIGVNDSAHVNIVYDLLSGTFLIFLGLVRYIIYLLPVGILSLLAVQVSNVGLAVFKSLGGVIISTYIGSIIIALLALVAIACATNKPFWYVVSKFRNVISIAFVSSSSFASMPFALEAMELHFDLRKDAISLFLPLNICLAPAAAVFRIVTFVLHMASIYGISISSSIAISVVFGSVLIAVATSSLPVIAVATMLGLVVTPLGIPLKISILLMIALANFVDPIITLANILVNSALAIYFSKLTSAAKKETVEPSGVPAGPIKPEVVTE